jgi:two-component system cell cycle sensor histidine kinase/response regulator CckA
VKETVLIVDDEPSIRTIASQVLLRAGYSTLLAADGAEALRLCREHAGPIHVLLVNLIMPMMNGLEVVKQAIALRPGLRVIYISDSYLVKQAFGTEPRLVYLDKPFTAAALLEKVAEVLEPESRGQREG